jgi:hypothetical protein
MIPCRISLPFALRATPLRITAKEFLAVPFTLKKLVVDLSLDRDAEGGDRKKELVDQRADANWLRSKYAASQLRVCGLMGIAVASYYYRTTRSDEPLRTQLVGLAREKPRFGYRRLHRVYREAGLM